MDQKTTGASLLRNMRIARGTQARIGMGQITEHREGVLRTRVDQPRASPSGMPVTSAARNAMPTRRMLARICS